MSLDERRSCIVLNFVWVGVRVLLANDSMVTKKRF